MIKKLPCVYPDCFHCLRPDCDAYIPYDVRADVARGPSKRLVEASDELYKYIIGYWQKMGYPPSEKEMREICDKHRITVMRSLSRLAQIGLIEPDFSASKRKICLIKYQIKEDSKMTPELKERRMLLLRQKDDLTTEVYRFVRDYIIEYGYSPTFSEIGAELAISSTTAKRHVFRLIDLRYLKSKHPGQQRAYGLTRYRLVKIKEKR